MSIRSDKDRIMITEPKILKNQLSELAEKDCRSVSNYIVKILQKHVDQTKAK
jgi:hypothetical protein